MLIDCRNKKVWLSNQNKWKLIEIQKHELTICKSSKFNLKWVYNRDIREIFQLNIKININLTKKKFHA